MAVTSGGGADTLDSGNGNDLVYAGAGDDTVYGGNGDDALWGQDGDDLLNGQRGNDILIGGLGDDFLDGDKGTDTAVYTGAIADYAIVRLATGAVRIKDLRAGANDGADLVTNVELFKFADGVVAVDALPLAAVVTQNDSGGFDIQLNNAAALDSSLGTDAVDNVTFSGAGVVAVPTNIENVTLTGTTNSSVEANDRRK